MIEKKSYIKQTCSDSNIGVLFSIALIVLLLVLRDVFSIGINKLLFVVIFAYDALFMKKKQLDRVLFFILPILNGLPGNYLIMVYLFRIIAEKGDFYVNIQVLFCILIMSILSVYQMFIYSYRYSDVLFSCIGLVFFAVLLLDKSSDIDNLYYYIVGTSVMSIIFILATLRVYSLNDILTIGKRLGDETVKYNKMGTMSISMDPNYLGLFAITACSLYFVLMRKEKIKKSYIKILLTVSVAICSIIALIGLSRAYAITYCLMILVIFFIQKKAKYLLILLLAFGIGYYVLNKYLSNVLDSLFIRFRDSNTIGGNGRIDINKANFAIWSNSIISIMFGIGLFSCEVHCMPLQYLFGGGVIYTVFFLLYAYNITYNRRKHFDYIDLLPFSFTLLMSCTVPLATSITYMTPVAISLFGYIILEDLLSKEKNAAYYSIHNRTRYNL
ncbi:hypothetical protein [Aristaeella hokkaidonensis]|uniref:Uncharacterized protein n=1 Tax=Aristaeella hokkaidonensis TaxID=3046382 RepID=A0AC61MYP5_9FIRM|nr:hypothetical protein [Aristaeella hokkaidonensis]QUC68211.1 hypothetical protein JYE49_05820 [Aristaeella hokkaidonensis]SNT95229.1 hypothetical protein SAMN06297421_11116 [Aristaeella hokkaidonensis]